MNTHSRDDDGIIIADIGPAYEQSYVVAIIFFHYFFCTSSMPTLPHTDRSSQRKVNCCLNRTLFAQLLWCALFIRAQLGKFRAT